MVKRFSVEAFPFHSDLAAVRRGLDDYENTVFQRRAYIGLSALILGNRGDIQGGISGRIGWDWLHVEMLWVTEGLRHNGHGARLLHTIEAAARARGIHNAYLTTTSFQAFPFYQQQGYDVIGTLEDRPPGHTYYYLAKRGLNASVQYYPVTVNAPMAHLQALHHGLNEYNARQGMPIEARRLSVFMRDSQHKLRGGLIGSTYWGWFDLYTLWVQADLRRRGYGAHMLQLAEAEAAKRGCPRIVTEAIGERMRRFFDRQGYHPFGILTDRPPGHVTYFVYKTLED
ncbi:MAG: hypothetical protein Kow00117_20690 [Phototrophicales bacterium]